MPYLYSTHAAKRHCHCFAVRPDTEERGVQWIQARCVFLCHRSLWSDLSQAKPGQANLVHVSEGLDSTLTRSHNALPGAAKTVFLCNV